MKITGVRKLVKLKKKEKGNTLLCKAIEVLISDLKNGNWSSFEELKQDRPDADLVHEEGYFFFNIKIHRTLIGVFLEEGEVSIVWIGDHDKYERIFKNNKDTIAKWLKDEGYIE